MTTERERDDHGRFHLDELEAEKRRTEVVKLHVDGWSFREIGAHLGIRESTAYRDWSAVLERTRAEADTSVDDERRASLARIAKAIKILVPMLDDPDKGLDAMDRLDKLEKRRAALLGLDAPTRVTTHEATVSFDELDAMRAAAKANACSPPEPPATPSENEPSS